LKPPLSTFRFTLPQFSEAARLGAGYAQEVKNNSGNSWFRDGTGRLSSGLVCLRKHSADMESSQSSIASIRQLGQGKAMHPEYIAII
jgi:hypothetical protein